jgi:hypothetical protein
VSKTSTLVLVLVPSLMMQRPFRRNERAARRGGSERTSVVDVR